jgi:hypothetical protein
MENFESKIFRGQNSPTFGRKLKRTVRHDITEKLISIVMNKLYVKKCNNEQSNPVMNHEGWNPSPP